MYIDQIDTPIGTLYAQANEGGLLFVKWGEPKKQYSDLDPKADNEVLKNLRTQISEYFTSKRERFDLPLNIEGTAFQKKIWKAISKIPFGSYLSYSQLAKEVSSPRAFRAAGSACGANHFSIIIPCHRVLSTNMTLGGYTGGLDKKKMAFKI